jgi:hypothetical protein
MMTQNLEALDSAYEDDGHIFYITTDAMWIMPEGNEAVVKWQGKDVTVRSLGGVESLAQNGRTSIWTVALEIVDKANGEP